MNCLKDFLRNPKKWRMDAERKHAKELQGLSYKQSASITEAILSEPWISKFKWKKDDHPISLAISFKKANEKKRKR